MSLFAWLRELWARLREWYYRALAAILIERLPPEIVQVPSVNNKRRLDRRGLTKYEETFHVSRQHWIVLLRPFIGLLSGLVLLTRPPGWMGALVALLFGYIVYRRVPLREGWKERLIAAVIAVVIVIVAPELGELWLLVAAVLIAWPAYDIADWWYEILVITNKRVLLMHGIWTVSRPSVKIRSIGFSNCISGPIGAFLHYGTIDLDTPSQRDKALSNMEYVPHAYAVWRLILQLHSEHFTELGDFSPEQRRRGLGDNPSDDDDEPDE